LERYVQLVLSGMRGIVVGGGETQQWSTCLGRVAHSMNTRVIWVHGYSPTEFLLCYNPDIHHHEFTVRGQGLPRTFKNANRFGTIRKMPDS